MDSSSELTVAAMEKTAAIQVGFAALRTPSGAFKKSVPIYMPETPMLAAQK